MFLCVTPVSSTELTKYLTVDIKEALFESAHAEHIILRECNREVIVYIQRNKIINLHDIPLSVPVLDNMLTIISKNEFLFC